MTETEIHIGDVPNLLRKVVDDWRLEERKRIRHRLIDFEDHLDKLEGSDWSGAEQSRAGVEEARERYTSSLDDRYAMIEEAHRKMVEHLEQREQGAD